MTCIVGKVEAGKVTLGADSLGASGYDCCIRKDSKLFRVGEFVIGCTSSYRMIQLIQYKFKPTAIPDDMDLHEYMVVHFVEDLRSVLKQGGFTKIDSNVEKGGRFLVGIRDRLFCIHEDFQVAERVDGVDSCGCGDSYAIGAMKAGASLEKTLQIAEDCSCGVKGPFHFLSTL
jgi:ATP-dependent protease HslVU (ClpYQ) peptidase subunit